MIYKIAEIVAPLTSSLRPWIARIMTLITGGTKIDTNVTNGRLVIGVVSGVSDRINPVSRLDDFNIHSVLNTWKPEFEQYVPILTPVINGNNEEDLSFLKKPVVDSISETVGSSSTDTSFLASTNKILQVTMRV